MAGGGHEDGGGVDVSTLTVLLPLKEARHENAVHRLRPSAEAVCTASRGYKGEVQYSTRCSKNCMRYTRSTV